MHPVLRCAFACCRAGYRRARDHLRGHPVANPASLVEQLVEVPTVLYFLKQKVDIPVPGGGATRRFSRFSSRTEFNSSWQWRSSRFRPGQVSKQRHPLLLTLQLVCLRTRMSLVKGFFRTFPRLKKCEGHPALECESAPGRQLIHAERSSNRSGQVGCASEPG